MYIGPKNKWSIWRPPFFDPIPIWCLNLVHFRSTQFTSLSATRPFVPQEIREALRSASSAAEAVQLLRKHRGVGYRAIRGSHKSGAQRHSGSHKIIKRIYFYFSKNYCLVTLSHLVRWRVLSSKVSNHRNHQRHCENKTSLTWGVPIPSHQPPADHWHPSWGAEALLRVALRSTQKTKLAWAKVQPTADPPIGDADSLLVSDRLWELFLIGESVCFLLQLITPKVTNNHFLSSIVI